MGAKARAELAAARADINKARQPNPTGPSCEGGCGQSATVLIRVHGGPQHGKTLKVCQVMGCGTRLSGDCDYRLTTSESLRSVA